MNVRVGITGHSNLAPGTVALVRDALRELLANLGHPLVGVSCLARGADQLFARAVLDVGGEVEVVLPARDYRDRKVGPDNVVEFDELVGKAVNVVTLPFERSGRDAYMAASERVLCAVDSMVAVWDGQPSDGRGGTADVVAAARVRGLAVSRVWPEGASRS
jgi:hypothetical protein